MMISADKFTITELPAPKLSRSTTEALEKWGLLPNLTISKFTFDQTLNSYQIPDFINTLFATINLPVVTKSGTARLRNVTGVTHDKIQASATSLKIFDDLVEKVTNPYTKAIKGCFTEYIDGIACDNELQREMVENNNPEYLYSLLKHLVLGGAICQYDETMEDYFKVLKELYKVLVAVSKKDDRLSVMSEVYKIIGVESKTSELFPIDHLQNFCYLTIDLTKRTATVLYHAQYNYY